MTGRLDGRLHGRLEGRLDAAARALFGDQTAGVPVPVDAYDITLVLDAGPERAEVPLGVPGPSRTPWTVELTGTSEALLDVLEGRATLGEAMYAGRVRARDEKAKHNLVVAVATTIRIRQDQAARRARR